MQCNGHLRTKPLPGRKAKNEPHPRPRHLEQVTWRRRGTVSLSFPNPSRSYDATQRAVQFWGHDGAMEASFFLNEDALRRIEPTMQPSESALLNT
jgi:Protein of unknown function (DUF1488)